ncbi:MAG: efflux RND transporter periplasmic adaptor subunit [Rhodocyclaceae bacterium]|nr:efflux RND transporter periplasmic adaptor subunit [Rhodocyclaceae bacterium]
MTRYLLVLLLSLPLCATADDVIRLTPGQIDKAGVVVAAVAELGATAELRLPAQVIVPPAQIEVIAAAVPTMVAAVHVAYGETVKKGQPLLRLQGGALLELQRDYAGAAAQAQLAAEKRRRDEALFADGIIAQNRLSESRAAETQALALAAERRASLRLSGATEPGKDGAFSGSAVLRAPFDGVVLEAAAQPGQRVDAMTPLLKLGRLTPLWVEIQASASQAAGLAPGDRVSVPGCAAPGRITLIAPHLQAASQSLLIRAELAKPAGCVKPFQFVQVVIGSARPLPAGTVRLPPAAVTRHQGKAWVFVAVPDGFQPVAVEVLEESAAGTTVSGNLPAAAKVAVKGVATLKAVWLGLGAGGE